MHYLACELNSSSPSLVPSILVIEKLADNCHFIRGSCNCITKTNHTVNKFFREVIVMMKSMRISNNIIERVQERIQDFHWGGGGGGAKPAVRTEALGGLCCLALSEPYF